MRPFRRGSECRGNDDPFLQDGEGLRCRGNDDASFQDAGGT